MAVVCVMPFHFVRRRYDAGLGQFYLGKMRWQRVEFVGENKRMDLEDEFLS